jgi:oxaloacetate decarboxylase alpha subunit
LNILTGERYKSITKETAGVLKGEYGATPAPVNGELQQRVLEGGEAISCRPADLLAPEVDKLTGELTALAAEKGIDLSQGENQIDDVLTYALFPQIGLQFLENRGNPDAFEPVPTGEEPAPVALAANREAEVYTVTVAGQSYVVEVAEGGDLSSSVAPVAALPVAGAAAPVVGDPLPAPLAGNIFQVNVRPGDLVQEGDVIVILEAMKMETEVRAPRAGTVGSVNVAEGDKVAVGDTLVTLG